MGSAVRIGASARRAWTIFTLAVVAAGCGWAPASPNASSRATVVPGATGDLATLRAEAPAPTPEPVDCPSTVPPPSMPADPIVRPAVPGILDHFVVSSVVAIGEYHGWRAQHDFFAALVCDPAFPGAVDAVVIEFANRRLQPILDRYVSGGDVTSRELSSLWRESTQRSGVFDDPVYARLLGLLRTVNHGLPHDGRIRVLAGDPPIDWSTVDEYGECSSEDPSCLDHWLFQRDESFAEVVLDEVLARGETALLIAGAGHIARTPGDDERPPSVPELIDAARPGGTVVVLPNPPGPLDPSLRDRIEDWPVPSLAALRDTWLGALDACLLDDDAGSGSTCPDGSGPTFADLADAFLYLGSS